MTKHSLCATVLAALLALSPLAAAEEFSSTPKTQTLAQAIQYEKGKDAAAEAQARKDAMEERRAGQASRETAVKAKKTTGKTAASKPVPSAAK